MANSIQNSAFILHYTYLIVTHVVTFCVKPGNKMYLVIVLLKSRKHHSDELLEKIHVMASPVSITYVSQSVEKSEVINLKT